MTDELPPDINDPTLNRLRRNITVERLAANARREEEAANAVVERMLANSVFKNGTHPTGLAFRTARQIATETPEHPDWICEGFVACGSITELDGPQKRGGKTTLTAHLVRAVLTGSSFLGRPTLQSPVVYLTEERQGTYREALRRAQLLERDDLHVLMYHQTQGVEWPEVVDQARSFAQSVQARLLVVDTLPQFAGLRGDAENGSGDALEAMAPLQAAAATGLGIQIVRHDRRAGGEVGDSGRGSTAFSGAVDIILRLTRLGDGRETMRELSGIGRYDEIPEKLIIELVDDEFVNLGSEDDVKFQAAKDLLEEELPAAAEDAVSLPSLTKEGGPLHGKDLSARTIRNAAEALEIDGIASRVVINPRNHKWYVCRPSNPSAHVNSEIQGVRVCADPPHYVGMGGGRAHILTDAPAAPVTPQRKVCPDGHVCSLPTPTGSPFCCGCPEED